LPAVVGPAGLVYGVVAAVMGLGFVMLALRILRERSDRAAKQTFAYSILYLFVLFAVLIAEHLAPGIGVGIGTGIGG